MKKLSTKFLGIAIALFMVMALVPFSALSVSAAAESDVVVTSIELGVEGELPTVGDKIFTPSILSVNGDTSLKDVVEIDNVLWQIKKSMSWDPIEDENYTFEELEKYRLKLKFSALAGATLSDEIVVTLKDFNVGQAEPTQTAREYAFKDMKFGPQYNIQLSEGLSARNSKGELITKAYEEDTVFISIDSSLAFRSISATPSNLEYTFASSSIRFTMPGEDVSFTAVFSDKIIDEVHLTSESFAVGDNMENFKIDVPQDANYSVIHSMLMDMSTLRPATSGAFSLKTYMLTVILKANDGYGIKLPFAANDEAAIRHSQISFNGWSSWGSLPCVGDDIDALIDLTGETNADGIFICAFYATPTAENACETNGDLKLSGYELNKPTTDISLKSGEIDVSTIAKSITLLDGLNGDEVTGNFALDKQYVLEIIFSGENITTCSPEYFTVNGLKPSYAFKHINDENIADSYISLMYELPIFHSAQGDWQSDDTNHWKLCSCGERVELAPHTDENSDDKCDVCDYAITTEPENDPSAPTPDLPEPSAPETDPPATETKNDETEAKTDSGCGGCGSSAALSALALVSVIGTALVIKKKKD